MGKDLGQHGSNFKAKNLQSADKNHYLVIEVR
jgi:hypothetical protein